MKTSHQQPLPSVGPEAIFTSETPPATDSQKARGGHPKPKLSRATVDQALAYRPAGKRLRVFFDYPKGLFLNVTPKGSAAYYLLFTRADGSRSETVVGAENLLTPALARTKAERLLAELTLSGADPVQAKRQMIAQAKAAKAQTFRAVADKFRSASENIQSKRTLDNRNGRLDTHILPRIGDKPVATLTRADIRECVRDIQANCRTRHEANDWTGHSTANSCHGLIQQILNWAVEEQIISASPAAGMRRLFEVQSASRVGKCDEATIRTFWNAMEADAQMGWGKASALCSRLIILTGQRPAEVSRAHKADFDFDKLEWRPREALTKTRVRYFVPLTPYSADLFETAFRSSGSEWAFTAENDPKRHMNPKATARHWGRARVRLLKANAPIIADCNLYDASRRFFRTYAEQTLRFPEAVCEAALNHMPDKTIRRLYFVGDLSAEVRKLHEAWQRDLLRIIRNEPKPDNVVSLPDHQKFNVG